MSPAVITETVWALCHEPNFSGKLRVTPLTTNVGAVGIKQDLLKPCDWLKGQTVWQALRNELKRAAGVDPESILLEEPRVIQKANPCTGLMEPLDDIRSEEDNLAVAEFLLDEVRRVTENSDCDLVASLAGGRKTMGSLLQLAMELLAHKNDRLTHVLVSEPFESPSLQPRFYFPKKGITHVSTDNGGKEKRLSSLKAKITLADVPILRLRELFPQQFGQLPGKFSELVARYSQRITQAGDVPTVKFDPDGRHVVINEIRVQLSAIQYALYRFMAERANKGVKPIDGHTYALDKFLKWMVPWSEGHGMMETQRTCSETWSEMDLGDFRKKINEIRKKFRKAGLGDVESHIVPAPRAAVGVTVVLIEN